VVTAKLCAAGVDRRVAHTVVHVQAWHRRGPTPVHRYVVVAKHNEFALGATTQLCRISGMYHVYHETASFLIRAGARSGALM
jgi:hypothetical protein